MFSTTEEDRRVTPCQQADPDLWFAPRKQVSVRKQAIALCGECPFDLKRACLEQALATQDEWAIAGGTTPEERRKLGRIA